MKITEAEYIAKHTAETLNAWEIIGISITIFVAIVVAFWIISGIIKHWDSVKKVINALEASDDDDEDCPEWAEQEQWEKSKVRRKK